MGSSPPKPTAVTSSTKMRLKRIPSSSTLRFQPHTECHCSVEQQSGKTTDLQGGGGGGWGWWWWWRWWGWDRPPVKYSLNLQQKAEQSPPEESPPQRAAYLFHQRARAERVAASLYIQRFLLIFSTQPPLWPRRTLLLLLTGGVPINPVVITSS